MLVGDRPLSNGPGRGRGSRIPRRRSPASRTDASAQEWTHSAVVTSSVFIHIAMGDATYRTARHRQKQLLQQLQLLPELLLHWPAADVTWTAVVVVASGAGAATAAGQQQQQAAAAAAAAAEAATAGAATTGAAAGAATAAAAAAAATTTTTTITLAAMVARIAAMSVTTNNDNYDDDNYDDNI